MTFFHSLCEHFFITDFFMWLHKSKPISFWTDGIYTSETLRLEWWLLALDQHCIHPKLARKKRKNTAQKNAKINEMLMCMLDVRSIEFVAIQFSSVGCLFVLIDALYASSMYFFSDECTNTVKNGTNWFWDVYILRSSRMLLRHLSKFVSCPNIIAIVPFPNENGNQERRTIICTASQTVQPFKANRKEEEEKEER